MFGLFKKEPVYDWNLCVITLRLNPSASEKDAKKEAKKLIELAESVKLYPPKLEELLKDLRNSPKGRDVDCMNIYGIALDYNVMGVLDSESDSGHPDEFEGLIESYFAAKESNTDIKKLLHHFQGYGFEDFYSYGNRLDIDIRLPVKNIASVVKNLKSFYLEDIEGDSVHSVFRNSHIDDLCYISREEFHSAFYDGVKLREE